MHDPFDSFEIASKVRLFAHTEPEVVTPAHLRLRTPNEDLLQADLLAASNSLDAARDAIANNK